MRKHIASFLVFSCLMSGLTPAMAGLQSDMRALSKDLAVVEKSSDAGELKAALENMRSTALSAQKKIPYSLDGKSVESTELKDYLHGYNVLISQIDTAVKLADEGKVAEVKAAAEKLKETRNKWHIKYRQ